MNQMAQGMYIAEMDVAQVEMQKASKAVAELSEVVSAYIADTKELSGYIGGSLATALVALADIQKEAEKAVETAAGCSKTMSNFIEDTKAIVEDHQVRM